MRLLATDVGARWPRSRVRSVKALAAAALLMLSVGACAEVDDGSDASTQNEAEAGDVDLDESATFRWGHNVGLSRFDPDLASSPSDGTHLFLTYDRLFHQSTEGEPTAGLAEDWEYQNDGMTFRLSLRDDVTFHDGEPFNAEVVKANLDRSRNIEGGTLQAEIESIEEVEVVDSHTVDLHLAYPDSTLPGNLSDRAGAMISPAAFDNDDLDENPSGSGMFEVVEYSPGDVIIYEAAEDYWDPDAVNVERFELNIMTDPSTRLNALRTGDIDGAVIGPSQFEQAEQAGLQMQVGEDMTWDRIQLNRTQAPFDDVRVREALNLAIDREALVESVYHGHGEATIQMFPAEHYAHNPDLESGVFDFDPERARELLEEAGLEDGFSFEALAAATQEGTRLAEAIQHMLSDVDIDMEVRTLPPGQLADAFYVQNSNDALISGGIPNADPMPVIGAVYTESFYNPGDHTTDEVQELFTDALTTIDSDERVEKIHTLLEQIYQEDILGVELVSPHVAHVLSEEVVGYERSLIIPDFRGVGLAAE